MVSSSIPLTVAATILTLASRATAWNDPVGPISTGYFSVFTFYNAVYGPAYAVYGEGGQQTSGFINNVGWTTIDSWLPYTIDLNPSGQFKVDEHRNVELKYGSVDWQVTQATQCGPSVVKPSNQNSQVTRCIVPIRP